MPSPKKPKRARSTEEPALTGLRQALERYPGMSRGAFARAVGVEPASLFKWLRGDLPNGKHIEIVHDFIEGRLLPREVSQNEWTLEPAATRDTDYQQLMLAIGEVAAGTSKLKVAGRRIIIERSEVDERKDNEALDGSMYRGQDASMNTALQPPAPPVLASFKLYRDEIALLARLGEHLGTTKTDVLRRAMRLLAEIEGVKVN